MSVRPARPVRADYPVFEPIETRWADNDAYGHVKTWSSTPFSTLP